MSEISDEICNRIKKIPILSHADQHELALARLRGEDRAREKLIYHNLRWVVKVAYMYRVRLKEVPFEDLIQWGCEGLAIAVDKYEPGQARLTTYAFHWIRQSIFRGYANHKSTIRIPVHAQTKLKAVLDYSRKYREQYSRKPTLEEISEGTGLSAYQLRDIQGVTNKAFALSIDAPIANTEGDTTYSEFLATSDKNEASDIPEISEKLLSCLDDRKRKIVILMLGFDGGGKRTLKEVGRLMGISHERVRQLYQAALRKMKAKAHVSGYTRELLEDVA